MQKNWKNNGKIEESKKCRKIGGNNGKIEEIMKSLEKLWTFFGKSKKKTIWSGVIFLMIWFDLGD